MGSHRIPNKGNNTWNFGSGCVAHCLDPNPLSNQHEKFFLLFPEGGETWGKSLGFSLLLVLVIALRSFSPGTPVFPSPQEPTF